MQGQPSWAVSLHRVWTEHASLLYTVPLFQTLLLLTLGKKGSSKTQCSFLQTTDNTKKFDTLLLEEYSAGTVGTLLTTLSSGM